MPAPLNGDMAMRVLQLALDGLSLRQQAISNNIANVDTPGFRASEVSFEGQLRRLLGRESVPLREGAARGHLCSEGAAFTATSMRTSRPAHISSTSGQSVVAVTPSNAPMKNDFISWTP